MIGYLSGWAAAGFGVRVYQLAIMKRNIFESEQYCAVKAAWGRGGRKLTVIPGLWLF